MIIKKIFSLIIIILGVSLLFSACNSNNQSPVEPTPTPETSIKPSPTPAPHNTPSNEPVKEPAEDYTSRLNNLAVLLPERENYQWRYNGFVEYGHTMTLDSITRTKQQYRYSISGEVDDVSGGESNKDYSMEVIYVVNPWGIIQQKEEQMMMDSKFDSIELIRSPVKKGVVWNQEAVDKNGNKTTLECTVESVRQDAGINIYTIIYNDTESDYYEKREIKEGVGVISFEKLYESNNDKFSIGYRIYYPATGYKNKLAINSYLPELNRELRYFGLAEYGHTGTLKKISANIDNSVYEFNGTYHDGTGIEDTFTVRYYIDYIRGTVTEKVMSATRNKTPEINSKVHNLVVLKLPVEKGNKWSHSATLNGSQYTVKAEIVDVTARRDKVKVKYIVEGIPGYYNNTYIETRTFQAGYGMTGFSNLFPGDLRISEEEKKDPAKLKQAITNHMFGYSLDKNSLSH